MLDRSFFPLEEKSNALAALAHSLYCLGQFVVFKILCLVVLEGKSKDNFAIDAARTADNGPVTATS